MPYPNKIIQPQDFIDYHKKKNKFQSTKFKIQFLLLFLITTQLFADFNKKLDSILATPQLKNVDVGIEIFSTNKNKKIYSLNSDKLFVPASCIKIITTLAALSILGPDFSFKTEFYYSDGDLYIKGYGDPTIVTADLEDFADTIISQGITEINNIIYDDFYFNNDEPKGWIIEDNAPAYGAKPSALSLNCNCISICVYPGNYIGDDVKFILKPKTSFVKVINKAKTGYKNTLSVGREFFDNNNYIFINGEIKKKSRGLEIIKSIENPSLYTVTVFKEILEKKGVKIKGEIINKEVPPFYTPIFVTLSQPLYYIIQDVNKESINLYSDQLLKILGAKVYGAPGTFDKGCVVLSDFLIKEVGLSPREFSIYDGSGLSYENKISPSGLIKILIYAKDNFGLFPEFISSLAIGGRDGTLKRRFRKSLTLGKIRAKTGTLKNISSLAGYTYVKNDLIIFSIMINRNNNSSFPMKRLEEKIIEVLLTEL